MKRVTSWGHSMYGGWYLSYHKDGEPPAGEHFRTINELRAYTKEHNLVIDTYNRLDN